MSWFKEVLLGIDRLGNAIAGGDSKATVSARVGFYARTKRNRFWLALEEVINRTFFPIDGPNHCQRAMKPYEDYRRGNDIALGILSTFIIVGCAVCWPFIIATVLWNRNEYRHLEGGSLVVATIGTVLIYTSVLYGVSVLPTNVF